jgi:hypothetical protein
MNRCPDTKPCHVGNWDSDTFGVRTYLYDTEELQIDALKKEIAECRTRQAELEIELQLIKILETP